MKRRIFQALILMIFICGIGFLSYPSLANYINSKNARATIVKYQQDMTSSSDQELKAMMDEAYAYNQSLPWAFPADPFTKKNLIDTKTSRFKDFKMVQSRALIGYIEIPKLDLYLPIYYGTDGKILNKGIGLIENTSLPVGGKGTHAVLSGHSGLPSMKLFTDIDQLKDGDLFFIHVLSQHFAYRVNQEKVVLPTEVKDLMIEKDKDYVSLLTCTPYGVNTHRLIIRGERCDYDFSKKDENVSVIEKNEWLWMVVGALAIIIIITFTIYHKKKVRR